MVPLSTALAAPLPLDLPDTRLPLAVGLALPAGTCELAPAVRGDGGLVLGPVEDAVAHWAAHTGTLVAVIAKEHAPCEGGPTPTALRVPLGGWAIGLTVAPVAVAADGFADERIRPLGEDRVWWHVPAVAGRVVFTHADALPPSIFVLEPDEALVPPSGWSVTLARGEARATGAAGTPIASVVEPEGVAAIREVDGRLVVVGLAPGTADGQVREGTAAPVAFHVTVTAPEAPPVGVVVRPGGTRHYRLDADAPTVTEVVVLDPATATVERTPSGLRIRGTAKGATAAVLLFDTGEVHALGIVVAD